MKKNILTSFASVSLLLMSATTIFAQKSYCYATVTDQPVTVDIASQPNAQNICLGNSVTFSINASGTEPFSYQWKKGGSAIPGAITSNFIIPSVSVADEGSYTCEVTNLCRNVTSNTAELKVIDITTNAGTDDRICNGQSTQLLATASSNHATESGTINYGWSPSTALTNVSIADPSANPVITTTYTVTATDQLGCTESDQIEVVVGNVNENENICLVSVDTVFWKNKVIWSKTPDAGTVSYNLYKETGLNEFSLLGNVSFGQASEYIDYSSQPESHGDKYKITAVDTCGKESELSPYHKSMNLTVAVNGTTMGLNWDDYVDESGDYIPTKFYIFRGNNTSNLVMYDSISSTFHSYNDFNVTSSYYYMVAVKKDGGCSTNKSGENNFSFSNKKQNFTGIEELNSMNKLTIYPNPFSSKTSIEFNNPTNEPYKMVITDITGKVVREEKKVIGCRIEIERGDLAPGVYFVELNGKETLKGKLIIE